ncbi:MAG: beta-ketoacyl synthase N-terminal-like domain-containing protein [Mycobacteriales bacterium]
MTGALVVKFGHRRVTVVDWSALSGLGVGRDDFARGFLAAGPADPAGLRVEDFDAAALLGKKGTRTLDRMTAQVIATAGMVLAGQPDAPGARARIGLVLGTSTGSVQSITEFTRDTFVRDRPYLVNPANFPSTVMNNAAGRTAIWYGLRGPNSTIAAGHLTGLVALRYASRLIRLGYVDTLLVGAVEEVSEAVSVGVGAMRRAGTLGPGSGSAPLGEGCAFFLLDGRDGDATGGAVAELVGFEFGMTEAGADPATTAAGLARTVRTLLGRTGVGPGELWLVSLAQSGDGSLDEAELAAVDEVVGSGPHRVVAAERTGNSFSALGAFQLAAALAVAAPDRPAGDPVRPCLLTSLGIDGSVGCALVRI